MAVASFSLPATLGFRHQISTTAYFPSFSRPKCKQVLRFGNTSFQLKIQVKHLQSKLGTSNAPQNPSSDKGENESSSLSPPLPTILAGIVVFLLFSWFAVIIVKWIIGLIINVTPS